MRARPPPTAPAMSRPPPLAPATSVPIGSAPRPSAAAPRAARPAFASPRGKEPAQRRRGERPPPAGPQRPPSPTGSRVPSPAPARTRGGLPAPPSPAGGSHLGRVPARLFPCSTGRGGGTATTPSLTAWARSCVLRQRCLGPRRETGPACSPLGLHRAAAGEGGHLQDEGPRAAFARTEPCLLHPLRGGTGPRFG